MRDNAAQDLIDMAVTCKELLGDDMPDDIQDAADDALRSLIKSMAILGYNLVSGESHGQYS
jgi:hypothetical protein